MNNDTIRSKITDYLARFFPVDGLSDADDLFELGLVNSLFAIQLVTFVESEFAVAVETEDLEIVNFSSIAGLVAFVDRKLSVPEPA